MIAWYVVWLTREGIAALGEVRWNWTVYFPAFRTPSGGSRLAGIADRSCDFGLPASCLKLATTSSAVISLPLWNLTPLRSWNVHDVAVVFGFVLVASHGLTWRAGLEDVR